MRKEAWHTQRRDQASGNPLFLSIYPQNQSLFYALTYTSDFTGALPYHHFSSRRKEIIKSRAEKWRRKWQPTPVFLPEESQGWRSLVGCHLWDHTELDTTEVT